ncbi:MAG: hypothetical protein IPO40_21225 [Fibrobacteres bacterium]|nr:hypothetical protein [Fibrobacterota bacterium]
MSIRLAQALTFFAASMAWAGYSQLDGQVVDAQTRFPIGGVRIVGLESGRSARTGADGRFVLSATNLPVRAAVAEEPEIQGGARLILRRAGVRYDWVSVSGERRFLATGPVNMNPGEIHEGFGWICSGGLGRPDCRSVVRVGRNLSLRDARTRFPEGALPSPTASESLSVWVPGRAYSIVPGIGSRVVVELPPVQSVSGDFHTHTYLSDGSHTHDDIAAHAFGGKYLMREIRGAPLRDSVTPGFGLDWYANTDHGGAFPYDRFGKPFTESPEIRLEGVATGGSMWRWQSLRDLSWPVVDSLHRVHPHRHLFQGVEWNVPGHEHASVGILASTPEPIARFEFLFDWADGDTIGGGWPDASSKILDNSHPKALAGARWLHQHHGDSSWIVINHPSRLRVTFIQDLRDLHDAAGPVFLGIEAVPGHQKHPSRGSYGYVPPPPDHPWNARTWGGADRMLARVGGVMDALWSEGRKVWVFANSDFHNAAGNDHYPGEYHKNITRVSDKSPASILAGLRRGATVAVMGDLVDSFSLELDDGRTVASMGGELATSSDSVSVVVRYHIPARSALGDSPVVDHIDLIRGEDRGKLLPGDPHYATDSVANVSVVATVSTADLPKGLDGWHQARWRQASDRPSFFRVRGSSLPRGTPGWTDSLGNPLCDELQYPNDDSEARYNRWFYSNPVFLKRR